MSNGERHRRPEHTHLVIHFDPEFLALLQIGVKALGSILKGNKQIMATLDELITKVDEQTGQVASMKTFIAGLEQAIKDALSGVTLPPAVQAKVDKVFGDVGKNTQEIVDAIDNNPDTPPVTPPNP